jgi:hypothetical protein
MENTNKIYARLDKNNVVIKMFSSVFEQPLYTDKLVEEGNEEYHAHVHLKYAVIDENGNYNYKYENDKLIELTEEEKEILFPAPTPEPTETEILQKQLLETQAIVANLQEQILLNQNGGK